MKIFNRLYSRLKTPERLQNYIRKIPYNEEKRGITVLSPRLVVKRNHAHCLEASMLAAVILEAAQFQPFLMSMESVDKIDHVVYIFRDLRGWGAISRSKEDGLHGRKPVFKSVEELARSYIDPYIDDTGRITGYAVAHLDDLSKVWRHSDQNLWHVERNLIKLRHRKINCSDRHYKKLRANFVAGRELRRKSYWI